MNHLDPFEDFRPKYFGYKGIIDKLAQKSVNLNEKRQEYESYANSLQELLATSAKEGFVPDDQILCWFTKID